MLSTSAQGPIERKEAKTMIIRKIKQYFGKIRRVRANKFPYPPSFERWHKAQAKVHDVNTPPCVFAEPENYSEIRGE